MMDKKTYLKLACEHLTEEFLLDTWFLYLAKEKSWVSKTDSRMYELVELDSTHLYNIKNGILEMYKNERDISQGAALLISAIDFILMKRAEEEAERAKVAKADSDDLPF